LVEKAVEIARRSGSPLATFRALRAMVHGYVQDGRLAESRRLVDELLASFERSGDAERNSDPYMGARFFRGRVMLDSDAFAEVGPWVRDSYARADRVGNRTVKAASAAMLGSLSFQRAEYPEAERWANIALPIAAEIDSLAALRSSAATLLLSRMQLGRPGVSATELESIEKGLYSTGDLGSGFEWIVEALLENGKLSRARKLAEARVARAGGRLRQAKAALVLGLVSLRAGGEELGAAERWFVDALERATDIGLRSVQGRAHLGLAEVARARGQEDKKVAHARQAISLLRPLELHHYEARAARLLLDRLEESSPNA